MEVVHVVSVEVMFETSKAVVVNVAITGKEFSRRVEVVLVVLVVVVSVAFTMEQMPHWVSHS